MPELTRDDVAHLAVLARIDLSDAKPRNPLVAPAHFRRAGSHQPGGRSLRHQGSRMLRRELDQMKQHSP